MPAPVKHPEQMNVVIFRENTEDVYAGIEWARARPRRRRSSTSSSARWGSAFGRIRGSASSRSRRPAPSGWFARRSQYAVANKRKTVTLVHKGNIMKFTEGAFRDWGYELAKAEFRDHIVTEEEVAARRLARGEDPRQRSHRRQRVPADADADRRVRRVRDAESERRLPLGRVRRAGGRPRHGARREHRATRSGCSRRRTAPRRSTPARTWSTRGR